jgi:Uma2 family endonuclease
LVHRYSIDEFFALDPPPEGGHYELIAGVLYVVPPPKPTHSLVVSRINRVLARYADAHEDTATLFVPRAAVWKRRAVTYLEPDLFMVSTERFVRDGEATFDSAELVIEVLSPATAVYDRTAKADTYAALGVQELWLVDPDSQTIEQRLRARAGWRFAGVRADTDAVEAVVFPGLRVTPAEIFAPPQPRA